MQAGWSVCWCGVFLFLGGESFRWGVDRSLLVAEFDRIRDLFRRGLLEVECAACLLWGLDDA